MSSLIASYRHPQNGRVVEIYHDDDPVSPLEDATPGVFLSRRNDRHQFGHEQLTTDEINTRKTEAEAAGALILPVHLHDHSGLSFSLNKFHDPWDAGCCGLWIASQEAMTAERRRTGPRAERSRRLRGKLRGLPPHTDRHPGGCRRGRRGGPANANGRVGMHDPRIAQTAARRTTR